MKFMGKTNGHEWVQFVQVQAEHQEKDSCLPWGSTERRRLELKATFCKY